MKDKNNDKHIVYLKMCKELANLSKCAKVKVGAIAVNNGRIVSTGINGSVKNQCNCTEHFKNHTREEFLKEHSEWSLVNEIHGEANLILFAAKNGVILNEECTLYCTHEPCDNCLKHIAGVGIKNIYFIDKYYNNIKTKSPFGLSVIQLKLN